jgi:hypothetical protein
MVLVVVGVLQKKPVHRARRVETGERLPCRKVLKVLFVHVSGERERVREAPRPDICRQTNVPKAEQTLGPRTLHGIDVGLGVEEARLDFRDLSRLLAPVLTVTLCPAPRPWIFTAATQRGVELDNLTAVFNLLLMRFGLERR